MRDGALDNEQTHQRIATRVAGYSTDEQRSRARYRGARNAQFIVERALSAQSGSQGLSSSMRFAYWFFNRCHTNDAYRRYQAIVPAFLPWKLPTSILTDYEDEGGDALIATAEEPDARFDELARLATAD